LASLSDLGEKTTEPLFIARLRGGNQNSFRRKANFPGAEISELSKKIDELQQKNSGNGTLNAAKS
jgi:hypothetical protein